jgi:hypothetical protein
MADAWDRLEIQDNIANRLANLAWQGEQLVYRATDAWLYRSIAVEAAHVARIAADEAAQLDPAAGDVAALLAEIDADNADALAVEGGE